MNALEEAMKKAAGDNPWLAELLSSAEEERRKDAIRNERNRRILAKRKAAEEEERKRKEAEEEAKLKEYYANIYKKMKLWNWKVFPEPYHMVCGIYWSHSAEKVTEYLKRMYPTFIGDIIVEEIDCSVPYRVTGEYYE